MATIANAAAAVIGNPIRIAVISSVTGETAVMFPYARLCALLSYGPLRDAVT